MQLTSPTSDTKKTPYEPFVPLRNTIDSRENARLFGPGPTNEGLQPFAPKRQPRGRLKPIQLPHFPDPHGNLEELDSDFMGSTLIHLAPEDDDRRMKQVDNLRSIREHFLQYTGTTGVLDAGEFRQACKEVGISNGALIDALFAEFDDDGSGYIDSDEICGSLRKLLDGEERDVIFKQCFNIYDIDGSGEISLTELQATRGARTEAKLGITENQRDTLIWMFKHSKYLDSNGSIDFEEFTALLMYEPRLMKAMFSTIMTFFARKKGINLEEPISKGRSKLHAAAAALGFVGRTRQSLAEAKAK